MGLPKGLSRNLTKQFIFGYLLIFIIGMGVFIYLLFSIWFGYLSSSDIINIKIKYVFSGILILFIILGIKKFIRKIKFHRKARKSIQKIIKEDLGIFEIK